MWPFKSKAEKEEDDAVHRAIMEELWPRCRTDFMSYGWQLEAAIKECDKILAWAPTADLPPLQRKYYISWAHWFKNEAHKTLAERTPEGRAKKDEDERQSRERLRREEAETETVRPTIVKPPF